MLGPGFPGLQHLAGVGGMGWEQQTWGQKALLPTSQTRQMRRSIPRRVRNKNQTVKRCCVDDSSMLNGSNVTMMESILSP